MIILGKIGHAWSTWKEQASILIAECFRHRFVRIQFSALILLNALIWLGAFFIYHSISQKLTILHYNIDFGIDLIGDRQKIFTLPALSSIFLLADFSWLVMISRRPQFKFIAQVALGSLFFISWLFVLALFSIYLANFK